MMPKREGSRKKIIETVSAAITETILQMDIGSRDSIGHLANEYYRALGYESRHLGIDLGHCWTKDGGRTYAICESDLFDVLDQVVRNLRESGHLTTAITKVWWWDFPTVSTSCFADDSVRKMRTQTHQRAVCAVFNCLWLRIQNQTVQTESAEWS